MAGPAECAGAVGVRGLLKTADIEVNCAVGLARPCSPFGGAADSKRFAHSAGPVKEALNPNTVYT